MNDLYVDGVKVRDLRMLRILGWSVLEKERRCGGDVRV